NGPPAYLRATSGACRPVPALAQQEHPKGSKGVSEGGSRPPCRACHKEGLVSPPDDILDTPTGLGRTPTNRASRRTAAFQPARISGASRASGSAVAWEALRLRPGQATPAPRTASNPNRPLTRTDTRICERGSTAA